MTTDGSDDKNEDSIELYPQQRIRQITIGFNNIYDGGNSMVVYV